MKRFSAIVFFALSASATSNFEVKELAASTVAKLESAQSQVDAAAAKFKIAQESLEKATGERDALLHEATSKFGAFESDCAATSYGHDMGASFPISYAKKFKRVEFRGKYALISEGSESCAGQSWLTNTLNGTGTLSYGANGVIFGDAGINPPTVAVPSWSNIINNGTVMSSPAPTFTSK